MIQNLDYWRNIGYYVYHRKNMYYGFFCPLCVLIR